LRQLLLKFSLWNFFYEEGAMPRSLPEP